MLPQGPLFIPIEVGLDALYRELPPFFGGLLPCRFATCCLLSRANFTEARHDLLLDLAEFLLRDLAQLELHLRCEKLLAKTALVVHLGLDGLGEPREDELDAADEQGVDDEHLVLGPPYGSGPLQLQANVDEVVGRPRARVL